MINCYILHCQVGFGRHCSNKGSANSGGTKIGWVVVVGAGKQLSSPPLQILLTQVITFPNLSIWNPMVKCDIWPSLMVFFVWDQRRLVKMSRWWSVEIESSWWAELGWAEQERSIILTNPSILTHFWSSSHRPFVRAFANIFYKYRSSSIFC